VTHEASAALPRGTREVVAESVVYAVCFRFEPGLSLRSAGDGAGWIGAADGSKAGMAAIDDGAALIDAVEALLPDANEVDVAA
jgi:hypothetical protein